MTGIVTVHLVEGEGEETEVVAELVPDGTAQSHGEPLLQREQQVAGEERVTIGDSCILCQQ